MQRKQVGVQFGFLLCALALTAAAPLSAMVQAHLDDSPDQQKMRIELILAQQKQLIAQQQETFRRAQQARVAVKPPAPPVQAAPPAPVAVQPVAQIRDEGNFSRFVWPFAILFLAVMGFLYYEFRKEAKKREKDLAWSRSFAEPPNEAGRKK